MNAMTAAHRRGKPTAKAATVVIENGETESNLVIKAVVRRNRCGTGPFDRYWLNLDCCGLFCAFITYCLHGYGVYAVCFILLPPWMSETPDDDEGGRKLTLAGILHSATFVGIATMAVFSHFKAMTTDPGAVPPDAKPLQDEEELLPATRPETEEETRNAKPVRRLCRRCRTFKPQRAHHCSVCGRCIIKMDHHCPWVNNCVGIANQKYFLLFVFYTFLSCLYSLALVIARFSTCHGTPGTRHRHVTCLDNPSQLLSILGLMIEALLFGMFTSCMIFDQWDVVFSKVTHIDRLKGAEIGGSLSGVAEVFGVGGGGGFASDSRFRWDWLSPFGVICWPASTHEEILGYCRPVRSPLGTELTAVSSIV